MMFLCFDDACTESHYSGRKLKTSSLEVLKHKEKMNNLLIFYYIFLPCKWLITKVRFNTTTFFFIIIFLFQRIDFKGKDYSSSFYYIQHTSKINVGSKKALEDAECLPSPHAMKGAVQLYPVVYSTITNLRARTMQLW